MYEIYCILVAIIGLAVYYLLFAFSRFSRKQCVLPMQAATEENVNYYKDIPWYKTLNIGALFFTPVWLFINGFWLILFAYFVLMSIHWQIPLYISCLLFVFGSRLSWGHGKRWNNNLECFLDAQSGLSLITLIIIFTFSFLFLFL